MDLRKPNPGALDPKQRGQLSGKEGGIHFSIDRMKTKLSTKTDKTGLKDYI